MNTQTDQVAVIGAPSSCDTAVLNLSSEAFHLPMLGRMLAFSTEFDDGCTELALATVTSIDTINSHHTATSATSRHIAETGRIDHYSGDASDTRAVSVKVEAVFRQVEGQWIKHSSTLSNSPATGTPVTILSQELVDELLHDANNAYIGTLRGSDVHLPFTLTDFSGPRGARQAGIFGVTGAGKSVAAASVMSAQLRHAGHGLVILDPQGQWANEHGMLWSLQGLARALGRDVQVVRLSHSLRLRKDAPMLMDLLEEAGLFRKLAFGAGADENVAQAKQTLAGVLNNRRVLGQAGIEDWSTARADTLLRVLLNELYEQLPAGMIYASRDPQRRVAATIYRPTEDADGNPLDDHVVDRLAPGALDPGGEERFAELLALFTPLVSLWSPWSPTGVQKLIDGADEQSLGDGDKRRDAWGLMMDVMAPKQGRPASVLILDLSADLSAMNLDSGFSSDGDSGELMNTISVLDSIDVKARVMKQLITTLLLAGQRAFSRGTPIDMEILIDEAWMFAPQPDAKVHSPAVVQLSNLLAGAARDSRKLGIGFTYILQAPSGLRPDIFKQLTVLYVGYGLYDPAELKMLSGRVRDSHLRLYQSTPPPEATGRYSWMVVGGGVTGFSFGSNPVFLELYNSGEQWLENNQHWVNQARRNAVRFLPEGDVGSALTRMPTRPAAGKAEEVHIARQTVVSARANRGAVAAVARRGPASTPAASRTRARRNNSVVPVQFDGPPPF